MKTVNTHEAKTHLSRILSEVEQGEEYILARAGKPVARIVPYREPGADPKAGKWSGKIIIHDDFDAEDERLVSLFEGTTE